MRNQKKLKSSIRSPTPEVDYVIKKEADFASLEFKRRDEVRDTCVYHIILLANTQGSVGKKDSVLEFTDNFKGLFKKKNKQKKRGHSPFFFSELGTYCLHSPLPQ